MTVGETPERRVDFYRGWSSHAAERALVADYPGAKTRCMNSARVWAYIADALEAGDEQTVASLTGNLILLVNSCGVPATESWK